MGWALLTGWTVAVMQRPSGAGTATRSRVDVHDRSAAEGRSDIYRFPALHRCSNGGLAAVDVQPFHGAGPRHAGQVDVDTSTVGEKNQIFAANRGETVSGRRQISARNRGREIHPHRVAAG